MHSRLLVCFSWMLFSSPCLMDTKRKWEGWSRTGKNKPKTSSSAGALLRFRKYWHSAAKLEIKRVYSKWAPFWKENVMVLFHYYTHPDIFYMDMKTSKRVKWAQQYFKTIQRWFLKAGVEPKVKGISLDTAEIRPKCELIGWERTDRASHCFGCLFWVLFVVVVGFVCLGWGFFVGLGWVWFF